LSPLVGQPEARAAETTTSPWGTRWIDKLAGAQCKIAFDSTVMDDGMAGDRAALMFDQYREVHGISDADLRIAIIMRQLGTTMGVNDAMWERYPIDERNKQDSSKTHARSNPYWAGRLDRSPQENSSQLEPLTKRGVIVLACNVALTNLARAMAHATENNPDDVVAEFKQNLIPGATRVASGVFGMARAQNAGCAYMRAS
jgi:hypothetical protein